MTSPIDHAQTAKDLVTPRYALTNVLGTVGALADGAQNPDDVACQIPQDTLGIDTAEGVQLIALANLVGAPVIGDEDQIRALIRTSIRKNRSSGTLNDILEVLDLALTVSVVEELPPAYVNVELYEIAPELAGTIDTILQGTRSAGVGLRTIASPNTFETTFHYAPVEGGGAVAAPTYGYGAGVYAEGVG